MVRPTLILALAATLGACSSSSDDAAPPAAGGAAGGGAPAGGESAAGDGSAGGASAVDGTGAKSTPKPLAGGTAMCTVISDDEAVAAWGGDITVTSTEAGSASDECWFSVFLDGDTPVVRVKPYEKESQDKTVKSLPEVSPGATLVRTGLTQAVVIPLTTGAVQVELVAGSEEEDAKYMPGQVKMAQVVAKHLAS